MPKTTLAAVLTEQQKEANQPIYLLEIELAGGTIYYTDYPGGLTFPTEGGNAYTALAFDFGRINNTITGAIDGLDITLGNADETFSDLLAANEFQGCIVRLKRVYSGLLDAANKSVTIFWGWIGAIDISDNAFRFEVLSPAVALDRPFPMRIYQSNCSWIFGGTECGADLGTLTEQTVDASSTAVLVKDAARTEDDDYWRDGSIEITSGAISGEERRIASSTSGEISVLVAFSAVPATGVTYTIKRGCDKSALCCFRRHDNYVNFGGFTGIPGLEVLEGA